MLELAERLCSVDACIPHNCSSTIVSWFDDKILMPFEAPVGKDFGSVLLFVGVPVGVGAA